MLHLLSTIDPDNRLFAKDYVPPKPPAKTKNVTQDMILDNSGFFDGLPLAKPSRKRTHVQFIRKEKKDKGSHISEKSASGDEESKQLSGAPDKSSILLAESADVSQSSAQVPA